MFHNTTYTMGVIQQDSLNALASKSYTEGTGYILESSNENAKSISFVPLLYHGKFTKMIWMCCLLCFYVTKESYFCGVYDSHK